MSSSKAILKTPSERQLSAILFADIVGYTSLMQKDEIKARQLLDKFHNTLNTKVRSQKGQVINNYGDGCLCTFNSAVAAVQCAKEVQEIFQTEPIVSVRIGLHSGDVFFEKGNVYGDSVNIASRIESMGVAGAVLFSKRIKRHISNQKEFEVQSLGEFDFINVDKTMEVFALANEGFIIPNREEMSAVLDRKGKLKQPASGLTLKKLALFAGIIGIFFLAFSYFSKNAAANQNTIAVLPLISLNQDNDSLGYFFDGLTQEIIDELATVPSITVSAFTQSVYYKDRKQAPLEIAKELGVSYLISGSSRIGGDSVELNIELINPHSNERIWYKTYKEKMDKAQILQLSIAKEVSSNLNIKLSPSELISFETPKTTNGEAFRLLLLAKSEHNKFTKKGFQRSRKFLNEAIRLDPNYAQAYSLLAWSYMLTGDPTVVSNAISTKKTLELVEPLIKKSIELNPTGSDIYLVSANMNLFAKNQIGAAKNDIETALKLGSWPHIPTDYCTCIIVSTYVVLRDVKKAKEAAKISKKIDPANIFISWDQANISMIEGDFKTAQKLFHEAADNTDDSYFNTYLGWSYYHGKEYDQALKYLQKGNDMVDLPIALNTAYLSNVYYHLGKLEQSDEYLKKLLDRDKAGEQHINIHLSLIYAGRNNKDKTLEYLDKAYQKDEFDIALMTSVDPVFKFIYDEPQFLSLREKMN